MHWKIRKNRSEIIFHDFRKFLDKGKLKRQGSACYFSYHRGSPPCAYSNKYYPTGLLYERTNRYCEGRPDVTNFGVDVQPYHNLFPIPFSEIERNTGAQLVQNPGYAAE